MKKPAQANEVEETSSGSAGRTLRLLQHLTESGRAMTLTELAEASRMPKATAHRLCARLLQLDFIMRDVDERCFAVGPALQRMAFDTLTHGTASGLRHEVLSKLVDEIGETCNFTTRDGAAVLYLDRVEAERPWRLTLSVGVHVPLHCTASGKLFLSRMPAEERQVLLRQLSLEALTENTLVTPEALEASVAETAARAYAFEREEFVIGLIAIAVPVIDQDGLVRAAIAMHCPTSHVSFEQALEKLPALQIAATRMSELL